MPQADTVQIRISDHPFDPLLHRASRNRVEADFSYGASFRTRPPEAYERLLHDAMAGDQTLFLRQDAIERSWEIVAPVLDTSGTVHPYAAWTWGPRAAGELITPRAWHAS